MLHVECVCARVYVCGVCGCIEVRMRAAAPYVGFGVLQDVHTCTRCALGAEACACEQELSLIL